ncbi:sulfite exporter TauE/SafE family protein [Pseudokordiimonas caeni]|uniref:sulfite exporter TauE/SafE family protein n=1 Tax=Pseudokordiimonas caeni TaxID=2997908 RepID=UPI0028121B65|nr:sulfite exporter TauE/SafE family protein [Pseudokordiimonas caeni]
MLEMIPTDPWFYAAAIPAVVITGISKGGFGGIALLAVPLLSLAVPPTEAAAIMLPLLLFMDLFGVRAWRGQADWAHLKKLLPGAAVGIIIGGLTASMVSADMVGLMVGVIAVAFCLYSWWPRKQAGPADNGPKAPSKDGYFWGAVAGYTSYIAHAGSPPFHTYLLPKKLAPGVFAATGVWFFALVNAGKLPAYILAGQLTLKAAVAAAVLAPLVPIGFKLGMWLNARVSHALFYRIIYAAVFLSGLKLIYDAVA